MTEEHKKYDKVYPLIYHLKEKKYYIGDAFIIQVIAESDLGMLVYFGNDGKVYNGKECYKNYADALFMRCILNKEVDFDVVGDLL